MLAVLGRLTGRQVPNWTIEWILDSSSDFYRFFLSPRCFLLLSKEAYGNPSSRTIHLFPSLPHSPPHHSLLWSPAEYLTSLPVTLEPNATIDSFKPRSRTTRVLFPNQHRFPAQEAAFDGHRTWFLLAQKPKASSTATILHMMKSFSMSHTTRLGNMCVGIVGKLIGFH